MAVALKAPPPVAPDGEDPEDTRPFHIRLRHRIIWLLGEMACYSRRTRTDVLEDLVEQAAKELNIEVPVQVRKNKSRKLS